MALEDILPAFQQWQQTIDSMTAQNAFISATEKAQAIKESDLADFQKRQEIKGLGDQLAGFLSLSGQTGNASVLAGQAITGAMPSHEANSASQVLLNPGYYSPEQTTIAQDLSSKEFELQKLKNQGLIESATARSQVAQGLQNQKNDIQNQREARKTLIDFQKQFSKKNDDFKKIENAANRVDQLIDSGSKLGIGPIRVQIARMAGEVGNLAESEQAAYEGAQSLVDALNRKFELKKSGELTDKDKAEIKKLTSLYRQIGANTRQNLTQTFASQLKQNDLFSDQPVEALASKISGGQVNIAPQATTTPGQDTTPPQTAQTQIVPVGSPFPAVGPDGLQHVYQKYSNGKLKQVK